MLIVWLDPLYSLLVMLKRGRRQDVNTLAFLPSPLWVRRLILASLRDQDWVTIMNTLHSVLWLPLLLLIHAHHQCINLAPTGPTLVSSINACTITVYSQTLAKMWTRLRPEISVLIREVSWFQDEIVHTYMHWYEITVSWLRRMSWFQSVFI